MNRSSINPDTKKTIISLFLTFILLAGTITTFSVYAQSSNLPFVTKSELQDALANLVTQEQLQQALANVTTDDELQQALVNVVTDDELQDALANLVTQEQLQAILNKTLTVIKNTRCEIIDSEICEQNNNIFQPSNFTILIEEDNNPSQISFPGSSTGTNVELEPGPYNVTEEGLDPVTPEICGTNGFDAGSTVGNNLFICTNFSEECEGDIALGNPQTCIIENVLVQQSSLIINKDWFVCDTDDNIDCTIEIPEQQISFQGPDSGNYTECTSEQDCPFANDAGFNINITGNNPTLNTIFAQINTTQQVDIEAGSFEVSEQLFSDELVQDAINIENIPIGEIGTIFPALILVFDQTGQRVFTANFDSDSVSIIDLNNANNVITIPLLPSGGNGPSAIAFDEVGQRIFTANILSDSVSIIELNNANNVINIPLSPSGGDHPRAIAFDQTGQRVFTANFDSDSVSIIDLNNANNVIDVDLITSGGEQPIAIEFDTIGQRIFTANEISSSISIIDLNNANNVIDVPLNGGNFPIAIAFDQTGQRVFTANQISNSVSIVELNNANNVVDVPLAPSGASDPIAIAFDSTGQRVFTTNFVSDSVSIIELNNANNVINVDLVPSGGNEPVAIVVDEIEQKVYTANRNSDSVSIIDLNNANNVIDVDLTTSGGDHPGTIIFDDTDDKAFIANLVSDSVSIIDLPKVGKICHDSGFATGDIRTFQSNGQTIEQITCVNFVGECSGNIEDSETRECTVQDYVVKINDISDAGINTLADSNKPEQKQQQQKQKQSQQILINDNTITKESTAIKNIIQQIEQEQQIEQNIQKDNNIMSSPSFPFILDIPTS